MNERIRELAKQADIYSDKHAESRDYVVLRDQYFAELIVRECAQFVEDKFDFIGDEIIVKEKMLEHFGVE